MFTTSPAQGNQSRTSNDPTRYGCFPMRIGFTVRHRLPMDVTLPSGRLMKAGQWLHLDVQDATRNVEIAEQAEWECRHPSCAGRKWKSDKALVNDHPVTKDLVAAQETHLYYAIARVPGADQRDEKRRKDGTIEVEYAPAKLPKIVLLSYEE